MSHKANDTYNEYMHENNICPKCLGKLTLELKDDGTTQGEYEIEKGHKESCEYYNVEVGGREKVDREIESFNLEKRMEEIKKMPRIAPKPKWGGALFPPKREDY